jgi:hypothetical protein
MAIEFLMLWMEPDRDAAAAHVTSVVHDPDQPDAAVLAMAGQLNLSQILLFKLAMARGAKSDAEVQDKASEILRELSLRLPG